MGGREVGWLLSRARYDATRLAEYAVGFGVADDTVLGVAAGEFEVPPAAP